MSVTQGVNVRVPRNYLDPLLLANLFADASSSDESSSVFVFFF